MEELTAVLEALKDNPGEAAVHFFEMGVHVHLSYDGFAFFALEVHTNALDENGEEGIVAQIWPLEAEEVAEMVQRIQTANALILQVQAHLMTFLQPKNDAEVI